MIGLGTPYVVAEVTGMVYTTDAIMNFAEHILVDERFIECVTLYELRSHSLVGGRIML